MSKVLIGVALTAALAFPVATAHAGSPNDTGLTFCLDSSGNATTVCSGTGQDADYGRDKTHPNDADGPAGFRFKKVCNNGVIAGSPGCPVDAPLGPDANQWACTKDAVTGLVWEVKTTSGWRSGNLYYTNLGNTSPSDTGGFLASVNAAALCGYTDWRLPAMMELQDWLNYAQRGTREWFPNMAFVYWTSTAYAGDAGQAWTTLFYDVSGDHAHEPRFIHENVMVVRGKSVFPPSPSFVVHGHTAVDQVTGLIWRRCAEGQRFQEDHCVGTATTFTWFQALEQAKSVSQSSGQSWRLPNVKELLSIVDYTRTKPAIDPSIFPDPATDLTWSSTAGAGNLYRMAWEVEFNDGRLAHEFIDMPRPMRLVRDAR